MILRNNVGDSALNFNIVKFRFNIFTYYGFKNYYKWDFKCVKKNNNFFTHYIFFLLDKTNFNILIYILSYNYYFESIVIVFKDQIKIQ